MTILVEFDLYRNDIISNQTANYTFCCNWCQSYPGCVAYAWIVPTPLTGMSFCYLKNGISTATAAGNHVSAHF